VGATVSIQSDERFRGRTLSDGRPVATLAASYDDASGVYLGAAGTGVATRGSGAQLLGFQEYIGYAHRLGTGPTLDVGVVNSNYTSYFSGKYSVDYAELYAGIITSHFSSHIRYSPDYFRKGVSSLYADIDGVAHPFTNWRLNGHFGVLRQLSGFRPPNAGPTRYDWRLGIARQIGAVDLQLSWTGAGPQSDYYDGGPHGRSAFVFGATYAF
jgi:uncharacterized protein (TIGR02001 family)